MSRAVFQNVTAAANISQSFSYPQHRSIPLALGRVVAACGRPWLMAKALCRSCIRLMARQSYGPRQARISTAVRGGQQRRMFGPVGHFSACQLTSSIFDGQGGPRQQTPQVAAAAGRLRSGCKITARRRCLSEGVDACRSDPQRLLFAVVYRLRTDCRVPGATTANPFPSLIAY